MEKEGADDQPTDTVPNQVSHITHREGESVSDESETLWAKNTAFGKGLALAFWFNW